MMTNKELYGTDNVPTIPTEIINERIRLLKIRLDGLLSVHFMLHNNNLIYKVHSAIDFWKKLRDGGVV